jgi:multidrug efflux system outer membrane protein
VDTRETSACCFGTDLSAALILVLLLGNLAFGQKKVYQPPAPQVPTVYRADDTAAQPGTQSFGDLRWFEVFKDEQLQVLIRTAIAQNYDVRQSVARINAARAQLGLARADQFPNFAVSGGLVTERLPKDGSLGELPPGTRRNISFGQVLLTCLTLRSISGAE